MKINNLILKEEAERWMAISPTFDKALKKFSMFISLGDVISEIYQFKDQELRDFIAGWIPFFLYNAIDNVDRKEYLEKEYTKLLQPVMDKIKEYCKSDTYRSSLINQQITGETVLEIDGVKEVIGEKAILQHIKRVNTNPLTVKDIEDIERSYIAYKRDLYRDPNPLNSNYFNESHSLNTTLQDSRHTKLDFADNRLKIILPKIDKEKYYPDLIYEKFNNVVFKCTAKCFNSWLVDGIQYPEKIQYILKGRKSAKTGLTTLNYAQLRKFIEKITGDSENTKDTYYKTVFGLNIKTSSVQSAINLNKTFKDLNKCLIKKK